MFRPESRLDYCRSKYIWRKTSKGMKRYTRRKREGCIWECFIAQTYAQRTLFGIHFLSRVGKFIRDVSDSALRPFSGGFVLVLNLSKNTRKDLLFFWHVDKCSYCFHSVYLRESVQKESKIRFFFFFSCSYVF